MNALKHIPVELYVRRLPVNADFKFSTELSREVPIASQGKTGRCWLFAGLTMLRYMIKDTETEFSYAYLYFHDKVNRYKQTLMTLMNLPDDAERHRMCIYQESMTDGGQWDLFAALVKKHGLIPLSAMPETFHATTSRSMVRFANHLLRYHVKTLRNAPAEDRAEMMGLMVEEATELYRSMLGIPPGMVEYKGAIKTPTDVFKSLDLNLDDFVSVVHDPRRDENADPENFALECLFTCENVNVGWISVSLDELVGAAVKALKNGDAVWFGANVDDLDRDSGVHDPGFSDYTNAIEFVSFQLTKRDRLETLNRVPGHAMVLTGVDFAPGSPSPRRWKVDNSWGSSGPYKGRHIMTHDAFKESVFQIVVRKSHLTKIPTNEPIILPPWDPLATLARQCGSPIAKCI